jgi:hypothetical protein
MLGQFNDIALKCSGIRTPGVGEPKCNLANDATGSAHDSWYLQFEIHLLAADRQGMKPSQDGSLAYDLNAFAAWASQRSWFLFDAENESTLLVFSPGVTVAVNAESMVQYARGHTSTSFIS